MQSTHDHSADPVPMPRAVRKLALTVGVVLVLLAVFMLYTDPEFMITVADQLWSCF
ncbi:hypothetical protein G7047_16140 [Diaphorobacter sp. HDW4A]|uniref:hypothetical protein n=1 Tax=Diaphorobacter sp. HDW4A TaxID=2714924 RepID=UPI00140C1B9F|nr:hypothetical protein [Diaphorobacter sp. HDW4A]QIL78477.1 hypothetical protein G7047_16140 [Diaphorobacter sp. HDW4A]